MMMIKCFVPRKEGNGWKLQKFHESLHLVKHIDDYGSSLNFDAGAGEWGLKEWVKHFQKLFSFVDSIYTTLKLQVECMRLALFRKL